MKIGIDASRAVKALRTGTENYSYEIICNILAQDKDDEIILYTSHLPKNIWKLPNNARFEVIPAAHLWSQLRLAAHLRSFPPDVLFVPSHVVPLLSNVPSVVTIHDLAYKYFPKSYSSFDRRYLNFSTRVSASKAKRIIVPSHSTKNDLMREYGVSGAKISVINLGYNKDIFHHQSNLTRPITNPYILYVGRIEEKKNTKLLVEAFALLTKEKKQISLVLSGKNGYGFEGVQNIINKLPPGLKSQIIQPGYLPQYDMVRYLQHAAAFVFPSFYEGFGLSIVEALAMGTPVICSNTSSLPEVVGDAAITLEPINPLNWAAAMSRVINQPSFAKTLSEKSLLQAKKYSWARAAKETLEIIHHVGSQKTR